jgi:hypothetical protein
MDVERMDAVQQYVVNNTPMVITAKHTYKI